MKRASDGQQTFITWISGACFESFLEGGGRHFDISAEEHKLKEPKQVHQEKNAIREVVKKVINRRKF